LTIFKNKLVLTLINKNIAMRTIFIFICFISLYAEASSQWVKQNTGLPRGSQIKDIQFINENTGFAVAIAPRINNTDFYSYFLKTTNGGTDWMRDSSMGEVFHTVYFLNAITGFVSTFDCRKTTDGGISWISYERPGNPQTHKAIFLNDNTGFLFGVFFIVEKTTNAGVNWQRVSPTIGNASLYDAVFLTPNKAFSSGETSGISTNGGSNWSTLLNLSGLRGISNFDSNNVMACGTLEAGIVKSTNGGLNWIKVYNSSQADTIYNSIKYFDINNALAAGNKGRIIKTTNGGVNWGLQYSGVNTHLKRVFFINSQTGWISGDSSVILKTTNGGGDVITNVSTHNSLTTDNYSLSQNYPNPFNPGTVISYQLPVVSYISLIVYDVLGNEVKSLVNEKQNAGSYSVEFNAAALPSGVYFYKLVTEKFSETKKMILVK